MEEEEQFKILEWRIDHFSCWNGVIHEKVIISPGTDTEDDCRSFKFDLFPRGLSGNGERMVVRVHVDGYSLGNEFPFPVSGKLSFISSDGSLICTQQVYSEGKLRILELPPGPKFEEVVAQIRENEALHKDRLTLRLRVKDDDKSVEYMSTKIGAFRATLKISSFMQDHFERDGSLWFWIKYEEDEQLSLTFSILECSKIELKLESFVWKKNISVFTRMTVLNNEDVVRTEENEHLFLDHSEWVFSNSLTTEEVAKKGFSLILYIKIIHRNKFKHSGGFFHYGSFPASVVTLMPSNRFRLFGKNVPQECHSEILTDVSNQPENALRDLSKDFMHLYQDQDFSDFQLKCDNISFEVHKNILSARSPVFKTMLSTNMREAGSGCMDIVDLEPSTLGLFLTFFYTGAVEELQCETALKLYYAADKYQVPSLKKECVSVLCSSVSISNVCDILSLADKHQDDRLTSVAHDFILMNFNKVMKSQEWKSFMRSEPLLAVETVTYFAEQNRVGEISSAI